MNASELILMLQHMIDDHGDLPVFAEDGMDPSDYCAVAGLALTDKERVDTTGVENVSLKVICINT